MKKFLSVVLLLLLSVSAFAHTLMMTVNSNDDGTATVAGFFSTGTEASGVKAMIKDTKGNVLASGKTDEIGEWTFRIPSVDYVVFLDAGVGHQVEEKGIKE